MIFRGPCLVQGSAESPLQVDEAFERSKAEMIVFGLLVAAGFAGGWAVRSSVDSSRAAAVAGVSAFYGAVERGRRLLAIEREHLEDLVAEGRARYETARLRAVHTGRVEDLPRQQPDAQLKNPSARPGRAA